MSAQSTATTVRIAYFSDVLCVWAYVGQARREHHQVQGSPTFVLNQGRQKLFGNVGYRVIAANIEELLHDNAGQLSWC